MAMCPGSDSSAGLVERLGHVAHGARDPHLLAVGGADAGALLAAMLQGVEAEIGQVGRFGMAEDAEDAALVFELIEHGSSWTPHYAAARLKNFSSAVAQICSASPTATSMAFRP